MACTKWEEAGLLYTSGELSDADQKTFEQHTESCEECRCELEMYRREHSEYYRVDMLGASPSEATDREILRVCSTAAKPVAGIGIFAGILARPVVAALLFLMLGLGTGTYVAYHVDNAKNMAAKNAPENPTVATQPQPENPTSNVANAQTPAAGDSAADSTVDNRPFPGSGSNAPGIVPVDLENK